MCDAFKVFVFLKRFKRKHELSVFLFSFFVSVGYVSTRNIKLFPPSYYGFQWQKGGVCLQTYYLKEKRSKKKKKQKENYFHWKNKKENPMGFWRVNSYHVLMLCILTLSSLSACFSFGVAGTLFSFLLYLL